MAADFFRFTLKGVRIGTILKLSKLYERGRMIAGGLGLGRSAELVSLEGGRVPGAIARNFRGSLVLEAGS